MAKVSHIVLPVADVDRSRDWQKNANGRKRMRSSRDSPPSVEKPNESASTPCKPADGSPWPFPTLALWHNSRERMAAMFKYGYVVKLPSGLLVRAGQDWGPTPDTYKAGDSLGVKNGKEGIVLAVVKGDEANLNGYDVMIVLEERPVRIAGQGIAEAGNHQYRALRISVCDFSRLRPVVHQASSSDSAAAK